MRRFIPLLLVILLPLMLVGCVSMVLPKVSARHGGEDPPAALDLSGLTRAGWEARRGGLREAFQREVYGVWPDTAGAAILSHSLLDPAAYDGAGRIEQYTLELGGSTTHLATVLPATAEGPVPVVVMQMFCGNRAALGWHEGVAGPISPHAPDCRPGGWTRWAIERIFGRHIMEPPVAEILEHGYALAFIYPGDIVPDNAEAAETALEALSPDAGSGAIAAWAWAYSRAIDVLQADERFDADRMAVWGHSRNGKSALLAAAFDPRIDLVIAHQAGTGGTTLSRSDAGESVAQITDSYPHWFNDRYAAHAGREADLPVDQHQLIALMAPRPLLIGGAWRDQWSDPGGSLRAARWADPVYALYGSDGLEQGGLGDFDPEADLAVFMRRGLHGVTAVDWARFLEFLDAHFGE
ncbi:MAG: alpha/beta hydrolase [Pseudomonadota bacterium]|nr:alpha/beta hydrolase [Pseudomonadota bacterium]